MIINQKFAEFAVECALRVVMDNIDFLDGYRYVKTPRGDELHADHIGLSDDIAEQLAGILGMPVKFVCSGGQVHIWVGKNKQPVDLNTPRAFMKRVLDIKKLPVRLCWGHLDHVD